MARAQPGAAAARVAYRAGKKRRMRRDIRLLVTSAGRRVELIQCFRAAARQLGAHIEIVACDLNPALSSACRVADRAHAAPPVADPGYVEFLLDLCRRSAIDLVVPTIDPELAPLSAARERFAEAGAVVAVSAPAVVEIARDKLKTAEFLAAHGVPTPRTADLAELRRAPQAWEWPLLAKPRHGSASKGIRLLQSPDELDDWRESEPMIAQELLRGKEYTVNMFFDAAGALRAAIPHERLQIRAGEVEKGVTRRLPELTELARKLAAALPGARGALCFQAIAAPSGRLGVFELNARFGGGYPLAHHAGATFTRWLLEERLGARSTANDDWRSDVMLLRYDASIIVAA